MGTSLRFAAALAALALVGSAFGDSCTLIMYGKMRHVFIPVGTVQGRTSFREMDKETGQVKEDGYVLAWGRHGGATSDRWTIYYETTPHNHAVASNDATHEDPNCPDGVGFGGWNAEPESWAYRMRAPAWNSCLPEKGQPVDMSQFSLVEAGSHGISPCADKALAAKPAATAVYRNNSGCYVTEDADPKFKGGNTVIDHFCAVHFNPLPYKADTVNYDVVPEVTSDLECNLKVRTFHPDAVAAYFISNTCFSIRNPFELEYDGEGAKFFYLTDGMDKWTTTTTTTTSTRTTTSTTTRTTTSTSTTTLTSTSTTTSTIPYEHPCILTLDGDLLFIPSGTLNDRTMFREIDRATGQIKEGGRILSQSAAVHEFRWMVHFPDQDFNQMVSDANPSVEDPDCPYGIALGGWYAEERNQWLHRVEAPVWGSCARTSGRPVNMDQFSLVEESSNDLVSCADKALTAKPAATGVYVNGSACFVTEDADPQFTGESRALKSSDFYCAIDFQRIPYKATTSDYVKLTGIASDLECFQKVHTFHPDAVAAQFSWNTCYSIGGGPFELYYGAGSKFVYLTGGMGHWTTTTTTTTTTSTTSSTLPSTTTLPSCDHANINLELLYLQELSSSYCGTEACKNVDDGADRIRKQESIKREMFPMFESLASQFASLKISYGEFIDKNIEPFGQDDVDFCYKHLNSLVPYDGEYRRWIEDHWARTWSHSGSGRDYLENQLDATISSVMRSDFSGSDVAADGKKNLRVLFMITDKPYHEFGDVKTELGPVNCLLGGCKDYVPSGAACQCVGHEYPSVEQTLDTLSKYKVNPIFYLGESDASIEAAYSAITTSLKELNPLLTGAVVTPPSTRTAAIHEFEPALFLNALDKICLDVTRGSHTPRMV